MTPAEIDMAILEAIGRYPKKVAMVVGAVGRMAEAEHGEDSFSVVAERIEALVSSGELIAYGNIQKWRESEIGLPG